jgi:excisionase family DNA binding protein
MSETFMTTHDAAKLLDVSPQYLRKLEETGKISAMRTVGGYRIFKAEDVERLAAERERQKQAKAGGKQ